MPGSLLHQYDAYSDISGLSSKSLDSKIGGKKVSFNNAVRVKQYPWISEFDTNNREHLTLPSSRFWFKVYKKQQNDGDESKHDTYMKINSWQDDQDVKNNMLSPIAEIEDSKEDESPFYSGIFKYPEKETYLYNDKCKNNETYSSVNNSLDLYTQCAKSPLDYPQERNSGQFKIYSGEKLPWNLESTKENRDSYGYTNMNRKDTYSVIEEENDEDYIPIGNIKLPRTNLRKESPLRSSARNVEHGTTKLTRERRSHSYDDYYKERNPFKVLQRADKSVSTEDLNLNSGADNTLNTFYKKNRNISTQCYGTLNRNMLSTNNDPNPINTKCSKSVFERLSRFQSPTSKSFNQNNIGDKNAYIESKNKIPNSTLCHNRKSNIQNNNNKIQNSEKSTINRDYFDHSKSYELKNSIEKDLTRGETKSHISRIDQRRSSSRDFKKDPENNLRKMTTIGYLRGRQIPLSEFNSIANRKHHESESNFKKKSNIDRYSDSLSPYLNRSDQKDSRNEIPQMKRQYYNKQHYISPTYRKKANSSRDYSSSHDQHVIDWSLSGFHMSTRRDNGVVSDSECTAHRRPPLLMYIPGVSHHHRPFEEDDRLSALSGMSRS